MELLRSFENDSFNFSKVYNEGKREWGKKNKRDKGEIGEEQQ